MSAQPAHAGGNVVIGDRTIYVRVLGLKEERALWNELSRRAKLAYGPGGYFARMAPRLDWLKEQKRHAEFAAVVARITEMEAGDEPMTPAAVEQFRMTADGVTTELFFRTRQTHADLNIDSFKAVVNETNAVEVHLATLDAITPPEPDEKKG